MNAAPRKTMRQSKKKLRIKSKALPRVKILTKLRIRYGSMKLKILSVSVDKKSWKQIKIKITRTLQIDNHN